jgi:hypothetical protein
MPPRIFLFNTKLLAAAQTQALLFPANGCVFLLGLVWCLSMPRCDDDIENASQSNLDRQSVMLLNGPSRKPELNNTGHKNMSQ